MIRQVRVASVYYREDDASGGKNTNKWKDGMADSLTVYEDEEDTPTYTVVMEASWGGKAPGTYCLAQSEDFKLTSQTGEFSGVDLAASFMPGRDIYAYVVSADGTVSKPERTSLSVKPGKSDLSGILSTGTIKFGSDLEITIPDDYPLIGGNTFSLSLGSVPIYVQEENGRIRVGFNISTDDEGYNLFKEYGKKMEKLRKTEEKFAIGKKLMKRYGKKTSAMKLSTDIEAELSLGGYVEMEPTSTGLTVVEGQIMVMMDVKGTAVKQFLQPIPFFIAFTLGAKSGVSAKVTRYIADSQMPFYFDMEVFFEPYAQLTGGVGVYHIIAIEATGGVSTRFAWKPVTGYVQVKTKADVRVKGYIGPWTFLDRELWSGELFQYENNVYDQLAEEVAGLSGESPGGQIINEEEMILAAYDPANYRPELLGDYLDDWLGGETQSETAAELALDGTGERVLQKNAYPDARTSIVQGTDENGDPLTMMVYLSQNAQRAAQNSTMVVYSVYDRNADNWSVPKPVDDDGTADLYPKAVNENGQIHVVWQNTTRELGTDENMLTDLGAYSSIAEAVYDPARGGFTTLESGVAAPAGEQGNGQAVYTSPDFVTDGVNTYAVWLSNDEGNIFGSSGNNSILAAVRTGEGWSDPVVMADGLGMIADYESTVCNGALYVGASVECTDDIQLAARHPETILEMLLGSWNGSDEPALSRLTDDETADKEPSFISRGGARMFCWNAGGSVKSLALGGEASEADTAPDLTAVEGRREVTTDAGTYLMWIGASEQNRNATEIYCAAYDRAEGTYGTPVCITGLNQYITSFSVLPSAGNRIDVVYQGRTISETDEGTHFSDAALCSLMIIPEADLSAAEGPDLMNELIFSGGIYDVGVVVTNHGMFPAEGYVLQLLDPQGQVVLTREYDTVLEAGDSEQQKLRYILPRDFAGGDYTVRATIGSGVESKLSDNTYAFEIPGRQAQITSVQTTRRGDLFTVIVKLRNSGALSLEDISLKICLDEEGETVLKTLQITGVIEHNEVRAAALNIRADEITNWDEQGRARLFLVAEKEEEELASAATLLDSDPEAKVEVELFGQKAGASSGSVEAALCMKNDTMQAHTEDLYAAIADADGNMLAYQPAKEVTAAAGSQQFVDLVIAMPEGETLPENYRILCGIMKPVETITLEQTDLTIRLNRDTAQLQPEVEPGDATDPHIVWSSSDETKAVVDESGLVTPVGIGEADITVLAADGYGAQAVCHVTVRAEHSFTEWTVKTPATCTEDGLEVRTCTDDDCTLEEGDRLLARTISKTGHRWADEEPGAGDDCYTIDLEPTEDTEGVKSIHCLRDPKHIKPGSEVAIPNLKVQRAAAEVAGMITAIGNVTLGSEEAIRQARALYEALGDQEKALVANYQVLEQAETVLRQLKEEAARKKTEEENARAEQQRIEAQKAEEEKARQAQSPSSGTAGPSGDARQGEGDEAAAKAAAAAGFSLNVGNGSSVPLQVKKKSGNVMVETIADGDSLASAVSANTKVVTASVSGSKVVLKAGKKTGKAQVTVTSAMGGKVVFTVKVQKKAVKTKGVKVARSSITLKKGESVNLGARLNPITSPDKLKFSVDQKKIVSVSGGVVKAKSAGKAKITIKAGSKKKTVTVVVTN